MHSLFKLNPRLVVSDPDSAMVFYTRVLAAEQLERYTDEQNRVVHIGLSIGGEYLSLTQSVRDWGLLDPVTLGGSPCLMHLTTDDPDDIAARFTENGGTLIITVEDRPYGKREGRVADPSGHLWILSKTIEELSSDEISRRLNS